MPLKVEKDTWVCIFRYQIKDSYFKYIGLMSDEIVLKDMYKSLINQIRQRCLISNDEERELNELFTKKP